MAVRTEELQLRVVIDGSPARRELAQLDQEYAEIKASMRDLKKGTEEWVAASGRLDQIGARQAELRKEIGLTGLTAKQLTDELRKLQVQQRNLTPNTPAWVETTQRIEQVKTRLRELNDVNTRAAAAWDVQRKAIRLTDMTMEELELESRRLMAALRTMRPNTAEFTKLSRELKEVDGRMATLRAGMSPFNRMWQEVKTSLVSAGAVLAGMFAGSMITQWVGGMVKGAAELSDLQADIQRTTGLTRSEVDSLTKELGRINTRTARAELLQLATDAGKLGISAQKDVLAFVRAGDQIRVALGEDLGEDAIKQIGKLNQTFQLGERTGMNLEQQMLSTGSAINALGQASTAQESYLVDFTRRLAGVATQGDISIQNTLGIAAALDQLGQTSETSSTAYSQFILKAFKDTADYAAIANMEQAEFSRLLKEDTNEALLRVLEGLNGNNDGLEAMVEKFGLVNQEGARAVGVLSSLAGNTKLVRDQQALANREFEKATSITTEFNTKNNTLAANLEIIGKRIAGAFVNTSLVKGINDLVAGLADIARGSKTAVESFDEQERKTTGLANQIVPLLNRYDQLAERTDLNETEQAELKTIIEQLSSAVPSAVTQFNKYGEALGINSEKARQFIQDQKDMLSFMNKEAITEVETELARLQKQAARIQGFLNKGAGTVTIDGKQYVNNADGLKRIVQYADDLGSEWRQMTVSGDEANTVIASQAAALQELQRTINGAEQRLKSLKGEDLEAAAATGGTTNKTKAAAEAEAKRAKTVGDLNKEIAALREKQLGLSDPTTYARTEELIKRLERERDLITGGAATNAGGSEALDDQQQDWKDWEAELKAFRERLLQAGLSADEQELRQLDVKHQEERARLKANALATAADLEALEQQQAAERVNLIEVQGQRRLEAYSEQEERVLRATLDSLELQLRDELAKWDELIAIAKSRGWDTTALEKSRNDAIEAINRQRRERELAEEKKHSEAEKAILLERYRNQVMVLQGFGSAIGGLNSMLQAFHENESERAWSETAAARMLALVDMATNIAVAITEAVASAAGGDPYTIAARVAAAVGAVLAAVGQAYSMLNSQQPQKPQVAQTGDITVPTSMPMGAKGGVFKGASHDHGGLWVVDPRNMEVQAEVEGDEPWMVLSKMFRRNNPGLIPLLLEASATGAKVPLAKQGGVFSPMPAFNYRAASQAVKLAKGGLTTRGVAMVNATGPGSGGAGAPWDAILAELRALRTRPVQVHNQLQVDARVKLGQSYDREQDRWARLKGRNTIRRGV